MSEKKSAKSGRKGAGSGLRGWLVRLKDHPQAPRVAWTLLLAAVAGLFAIHARGQVIASEDHAVAVDRLAEVELPAWLAEDAREDLADLPFAEDRVSIFTDDLALRVARTYATLPWVRRVHRVHVVPPGRLEFDLDCRRPVAVLEYGGERHLVDETAFVLPDHLYPLERQGPLPTIQGLGAAALAEGAMVDSEPLEHGLSVIRALSDEGLLAEVGPGLEVDVSNVGGRVDGRRPEIVLTSPAGTEIQWGRAPCSEALERPLTQKIAHLRELLRANPGLEGIQVVMLQFGDQVWR